jgi:hypothetical protein
MGRRHRTQNDRSDRGLSRGWKWGLSLLVVFHLLAVFAEPFRFFTRSGRGTSPAADPIRWALTPYIEFAYLNHGYFFFAPEPGPSHLMECQLQMADGEQRQLRFPDKFAQRPRLLYHRHFMLAEFLNGLHVPPFRAEVTVEDARLAQDWQADRQLYERVRDSMTEHLVAKYGAVSGKLERLEHRLPSSEEVFEQRLPLSSPTLYVTLPDAPLDAVGLPPLGPQFMPPQVVPAQVVPAQGDPVVPMPPLLGTPAAKTEQSAVEEVRP